MEPIGLIPAAGRGQRLGWWASKELYPVQLADGSPVPIARFALDAIRRAGATQAVVVIAEDKGDIVQVLGDGRRAGLELAYVVQSRADGLPGAIRAAASWLGDRRVAMALPDTLFAPRDALTTLVGMGGDLALGLFPTDTPGRLAPVALDGDRVRVIQDKPSEPVADNTWGAVAWGPRFTRFCVEWDAANPGSERTLSAVMQAAVDAGMEASGHAFEGVFLDGGTPAGLERLQRAVSEWRGSLITSAASS